MRNERKYLISLQKRRSIIALIAGVLVFCCTMSAVAVMLLSNVGNVESRFHYFTVQSNLFSAVGAAFMIPYAVEGIRKKQFALPGWIVMLQYSGAICVSITMVTSILIIFPVMGKYEAFYGARFWLHVVTPLCTVILFQCVETGVTLTRRDTILAQIPYWVYLTEYLIMVVFIGKENGGWSDFYMTQRFCPAWVSMIIMILLGSAVAVVLRLIQNRHASQSRKRLSALWCDELEPVELLIEAFGLGRYMGKHCDRNDLTIPVEIFSMMTERYDVSLDDLARAFVKGAVDSIERSEED